METPIHSEFSSLPSLEIPNPPVTSGRRELRWAPGAQDYLPKQLPELPVISTLDLEYKAQQLERLGR